LDEDPIKLWQHIHGASSHFPVAGIILSFLFDLGATLFRRPNWRHVGFWTLIATAIVSVPAVVSGLSAQLGWFGVDKWQADHLLIHRNVALGGAGLALLLALWRVARRDDLKGGEWIAYLVLAAVATGLLGYTGFLGAYVARGY
jgi:uncharacterized membrane protein